MMLGIALIVTDDAFARTPNAIPEDALEGWRCMEKVYARLCGKLERVTDQGTRHVQFKLKDGQFQITNDHRGAQYRILYVENPWYSFELIEHDSRARPATRDLLTREDRRYGRFRDRANSMALKLVHSPFSIAGVRLRELVSSPNVVIRGPEPTVRNDRVYQRIEFAFRSDPGLETPMEKGWVLCDPARCWSVQEADCSNRHFKLRSMPNLTPRYHAAVRITYEGEIEGVPRISQYELSYPDDPRPSKGAAIKAQFTDVRVCDVPDGEFRLAHFGFPEPSFAPPVGPSSRMIALALVALALVLAILAYLLYRRRRVKHKDDRRSK